MQVAPIKILAINEYIKGESKSDIKHEYINGELYAMVGVSKIHSIIAGTLHANLYGILKGSGCQLHMSDMKVKINDEAKFYYPDLAVSCSKNETENYYLKAPKLIVEVLSKSTEAMDRFHKRLDYKKLSSLEEYVLISQDEIQVEIYRRIVPDKWELTKLLCGDDMTLVSVGLTMPVANIYEDAIKLLDKEFK